MKAKDLKNSILQMAVQGKLVPQNPDDEPASVLLERIRAERAKLIKEKKIKAPKGGESIIYLGSDGSRYEKRVDAKGRESEPACIDGEIPFEIPDGWEWARLSSLGEVVGGGTPKTNDASLWADKDEGIAWLTPADMKFVKSVYVEEGARFISQKGLNGSSAQLMPANSVLMSSRAPIGYIAISKNPISTNQGFKSLVPQLKGLAPWVYWALQGQIDDIKRRATGTTFKEISGAEFSQTLIPIPPLTEQRRIVERVSGLMPLVEEYGKLEDEREALDAALPDRLRKSVLQMAVEGKLAPQDSSDEPASALLERIREERAKLIKEKKIKASKGGESVIYLGSDGRRYEKRDKGEPVCIDDEIPFDIPRGWEWARLESVSEIQLGKMLDKQKNKGVLCAYLGNANVQWGSFDLSDLKSMPMSDEDMRKYALRKGDLLVCEGGVPGRCAIWDGEKQIFYQKALHRIRAHGTFSVRFIELFFQFVSASHLHRSEFTGTTIKHLPAQQLKRWLIPVPPAAEQGRIVERIDSILENIN